MARGKNDNIDKYVKVFDKKSKGEGPTDREVHEGTTEELNGLLDEEIKKNEGLKAQLEDKDRTIREFQDRISNMENLDLEEELRAKVEELNHIKNAYAKKMKNTIALQRIKYEKEIDQVRKDMKKFALTKGGYDDEMRRKEQDLEAREVKLENKEMELDSAKKELDDIKKELETTKTQMSSIQDSTKEVEPGAIEEKEVAISKLEEMVSNREIEISNLKDALEEEAKKKEAAQQELTNVKKGSVAMMKYVTSLQSKKSEEELSALRETMEGEIEKRQAMEEEVRRREEEIAKRETEFTKKIEEVSKGKVDLKTVKDLEAELENKGKEVKKREENLKAKEKALIQKFKSLEAEIKKKIKDAKIIQDIKREFTSKEEDLKKVKVILQEKEAEIERREMEMEHRLAEMGGDKAMEKEVTRLQKMLAKKDKELEDMKAAGPSGSADMTEEVTALQELVLLKEDEISKKEDTIEKLKYQINKISESDGKVDVAAIEEAVAEKMQEISRLEEVIREKDKMLASSKSSSGAGMKELFDEVKDLRARIEIKDIELKKLKDAVAYKDEEISRRELDMAHKEEVLKKEQRKIAEAKKMGASVEETALKKRLEALEMQVTQKEEELKQRESYIARKMEELKRQEGDLVEEDLAARSKEREIEFKEEKIKSGNPRLDDLLYGGIPFGKQILVMGPPFIGKETQVNNFLLEGITKGVPSLILTTDCSPQDMRDEIKYILPEIEQYEDKGLLKYIDAYSKAMGMDEEDPNIIFVEHPTDYKGINRAIEDITREFKKFSKYWTMAVRSISTLVTYSDPTTTYRFLQGITGRAKRNRIVCMYLLDKGMHNEQEIQTIGHLMDGSFEFKTDGVKTFVMVQGICDVQSRAWIQYQYSKRGLNIGSFSLDHIK